MTDFTMPSLGADMDSGTIVEWLVKPGDQVQRGEPMAVGDTDKAAVEIETFQSGVVGDLLVEPGQRVAVGTPLAILRAAGEEPPAAAPAEKPPKRRRGKKAAAPRAEPAPGATRAPALERPPSAPPAPSPPLRHHAAQLGVDLAAVTGTGPQGR